MNVYSLRVVCVTFCMASFVITANMSVRSNAWEVSLLFLCAVVAYGMLDKKFTIS